MLHPVDTQRRTLTRTQARTQTHTRTAWLMLAALLLLALAAWNLERRMHASIYLDLGVYRWAGSIAGDPGSIYALTHPALGLRFTYTPFAALAFIGASAVGMLESHAWTAGSLLALARMAQLLARAGWPSLASRGARLAAAAGILALLLFTEPADETLRLGQVNCYLGWLILEDLLGPRRRWSGALVGLAAAIKLTPAIFLVSLALARRTRELLVGVATFAAAGLVGFIALPAESRDFWSGTGFRADRVGAVEFISNQSLNGVLWRVVGPGGSHLAWAIAALVLGGACLLLARRFWRHEERLTAVGLASLAGLLASPVSWSHHWLLIAPLLVGLWQTPRVSRPRRLLVCGIVAASYAVFCTRVLWHMPEGAGIEFQETGPQQVIGSAYVLVGLALLAAAFVARPRRAGR